MANKPNIQPDPNSSPVYEIRIEGHLGQQWTTWFEGLTITPADNGETLISGPIVDQAALHGLLRKVRDLGLSLIAVRQVQPDESDNNTS